jgi:hypothetical protein
MEKIFQGNICLLYFGLNPLNALLQKPHFLLHPSHVVFVTRRKTPLFQSAFISNVLDSNVSLRLGLGLMRTNALDFTFMVSVIIWKECFVSPFCAAPL